MRKAEISEYESAKMSVVLSITDKEALAALAEEATELAQAALKLRRAMDSVNPTPVTRIAAEVQLAEEVADVKVCLEIWQCGLTTVRRKEIKSLTEKTRCKKMLRWAERLKKAKT